MNLSDKHRAAVNTVCVRALTLLIPSTMGATITGSLSADHPEALFLSLTTAWVALPLLHLSAGRHRKEAAR